MMLTKELTGQVVPLSMPVLADQQVNAFHRDGWLLVKGACSVRNIQAIDTWVKELMARPEVVGQHWVFHEANQLDSDSTLISRIENIVPFVPQFMALVEALRAPVGQLMGDEAVLFKEKINFKMAGGDGFRPHQDSQAGWEDFADQFVTAALCIDEATVENGCLQIASGHHVRGLFRKWESLSESEMCDMEFIACPMCSGDVVFIDSYTPHQSESNFMASMRRMYFATYNRASAGERMNNYYEEKRKNYPPDIERQPGKQYVFRV